MNAAPGEVCGVCAAPLRVGARFCGRCGAGRGRMIPRELGVGAIEEEPRARAPAALDGRGLVVALGVYFALLVPTLVVLARPAMPTPGTLLAIHLVAGVVGIAGLAALGRAGLAVLVPRRWRLADAAIAVAATAAVLGAVQGLERAVPWLFLELDLLLVDERWSRATMLLHVALIPAVTEELAFRGAILTGLRGLLSDRSAIAASAAVFAVAHLSVASIPHLTVLGVVFGWARVRTGSIWPCVALHAAFNVATVLLSF
ncbi:MAG: CPBP family intramembrane metalloprotease [Deltaproteobacteria bacterium]|nr:CPBP family intramembrane metalloprotease [Kofleriaceae bacterium]